MFGVGAVPAWLSRAALCRGQHAGRRKKILVAIFQRGAVDGLNVVVPFGEPRYYDTASHHRAFRSPTARPIRRSTWTDSSDFIRRSRR